MSFAWMELAGVCLESVIRLWSARRKCSAGWPCVYCCFLSIEATSLLLPNVYICYKVHSTICTMPASSIPS
jgi:hypothetical protein